MKRLTICTTVCFAVLAIGVGSALAQTENQAPMETPSQSGMTSQSRAITGTIVSVTDNAMVISKDDGTRMTLALDSQTNRPSAVKAGDRVRIDYTMMGPDGFHAVTVSEVSVPSASSPSGSAYGSQNSTTTYGGESSANNMNRTDESGRNLPATASPLTTVAIAGIALIGLGILIRRRAHSH